MMKNLTTILFLLFAGTILAQPVRTTITDDGVNVTVQTPVNIKVIPICDFHWVFVDGQLKLWIEGGNELIPGGRLGNFTVNGATTQASKLAALGAISDKCSTGGGGGLDSLYYGTSLLENGDTIPVSGGGGSNTASNGLTLSGSDIKLGGTLSQNTSFAGAGFDWIGLAIDSFYWDVDALRIDLDGQKFLHLTGGGNGGSINENMFMGYQAGASFAAASTGYANTVYGRRAGFALNGSGSNASSNALFGYSAGAALVLGTRNSFFGVASGATTGTGLIGAVHVGHHSGISSAGSYTVLLGTSAGEGNTRDEIVAVGYQSLIKNTALYNVSGGAYSGAENTSGDKNTDWGWSAGKLRTTATEETNVGYLAGGNAVSSVGYNTNIGSGAGKAQAAANTNVNVGRNAGTANATGDSGVRIGNNAGHTGTDNDNTLLIGNAVLASTTTSDNEMNLVNAFYGEATYSTAPRFGLGKWPNDQSGLDLGLNTKSIIIPKGTTAAQPATTLERGMIRFDTDYDQVMQYDTASGGFLQVSKLFRTDTTKTATGIALNSKIQNIVYDCSANNIAQSGALTAASTKGWGFRMSCINCATNAVTVSGIPTAYINGVSATSFTLKNGETVNWYSNGLNWFITKTAIRLSGYTVATLPASPTIGDTAYVTDAVLPAYLALLTGGGSVVTPVFYNGTAWVSH